MSETFKLEYSPRELFLPYHETRKRFQLLCVHRRAGKTYSGLMECILRAAQCDNPRPLVAYIAPYLKQAKDIAWQYLKDITANFPNLQTNEAELWVDIGDRRIRLYGADNYESLRGKYLDYAFCDEFAFWKDDGILPKVIMPMLADRTGALTICSTPNGENQFFDFFQLAKENQDEWFFLHAPASKTGIIPDKELLIQRQSMSEQQYLQEFECSFAAAATGSYYGRLLQEADVDGRLCHVAHEPNLQVSTAWDLGIGDHMAIWFFQLVGNEVRIIDYIEDTGHGIPHYVKLLQNRPYIYEAHYLPHDARVRELANGKSRIETMANLGIIGTIVPNVKVDDGIEAARQIIPRCWFDAEKCKLGLRRLRNYIAENNRPVHDENSHAADAFRYLSLGIGERSGKALRKIVEEQELTMDMVWDRYDRLKSRQGGERV